MCIANVLPAEPQQQQPNTTQHSGLSLRCQQLHDFHAQAPILVFLCRLLLLLFAFNLPLLLFLLNRLQLPSAASADWIIRDQTCSNVLTRLHICYVQIVLRMTFHHNLEKTFKRSSTGIAQSFVPSVSAKQANRKQNLSTCRL